MTGMMLHAGGREISFPELAALPAPLKLGRFHKPVPHFELVERIHDEIVLRDLVLSSEKFGVAHDARLLFALFTFAGASTEREWALAVRSSTDQSYAIQGVAGAHVFICDNLALSGETFLFTRKHTTNLYLTGVVGKGFDKYIPQQQHFDLQVKVLSETPVKAEDAKLAIYDAFTKHKVAANKYLPEVHRAYFEHGEAGGARQIYPEVSTTRWGLHNAFTRVFRDMDSMVVKQESTQRLGKVFGL